MPFLCIIKFYGLYFDTTSERYSHSETFAGTTPNYRRDLKVERKEMTPTAAFNKCNIATNWKLIPGSRYPKVSELNYDSHQNEWRKKKKKKKRVRKSVEHITGKSKWIKTPWTEAISGSNDRFSLFDFSRETSCD